MLKCIELLPCDWLISNFCYQAVQACVPNKVAGERIYIYIYIQHLFYIVKNIYEMPITQFGLLNKFFFSDQV